MGQFQADPIGLAGDPNPYLYALNNPLRYTDPTGEFVPLIIIGGIIIRAGGAALFDAGIQAAELWWSGCDPLDWANYDKSSIAISAAAGAIIPGPLGFAKKTYDGYKKLGGAPRVLNRATYDRGDRSTLSGLGGQVTRGAAVAAAKRLYDWIFGD